jgi:hypothetical protein
LRSVTEAPPVDLGALGAATERTLAVLGFPGGPPAAESP